ncbi:threonine--tRNA ligase [Candidatus Nomurabacteria bacterium RIFCSPHIGHO2_01_FULL_41_91]|uniref:Threonine--tRNA ligase n=1 Tax=Candidatus Nomurabacteria bacterium RIFCSPLOWO2_12_FULL_41_10 TaxID=1801795 RepID=A0A1F6YD84_9BACT|nr:MAG: threonine--tRNA ligase [Candidatus Nomurabacteria bacterium RIFCSPHIGHO2_01_FULL_41_91]OGI80459.1 MAG: threonine--tRNA ligase [Candidatus Nomurabacteria bacterium RIFCSPHIGHO2_02_FULL_41_52]OGI85125.1 MAG: threonine--tRNA ligase [Candidatus Nomurabacteria bacterium RIFCSPHIGHO2_12_FULL_42_19]OGI94084.1 MAG: threonine--tRNA ligase [Candidatus Nomurabacteria bacterium RIFCSPLOWO2_01_FULL_41_52]OGI99609.1 MAG: threonine--tRNA ligase [Candidatus Nomurabacteria bacterium RIFCSPLOWO2_02_FULL_
MEKTEKLGNLRHTLAHLLASAIGEIYKFDKIKLTLGPAIDNGFYYDIDFCGEKMTDADLKKIEDKMRKNLPKWTEWEHKEISKDEALEFFKNEYKAELINEIALRGEKITTYTCGGFTDLCRGGHLAHPSKEIDPDSFKLDRVAGAYWRGDEKNKMLTRIYGLAFETKEELDAYLTQREEAEKRDHRKLGQELDIFIFDDDVGPGLPLWLPNGAVIIEELEKLAKETEEKAGYVRVRTPHIAKESMYKKSGHLPYYADSMYSPMDCEGENYYLKAMNCPHHHKIFAARPKSYRDLPLRLAEYGTVYRYEKSGELFGLMRVRSLSMNDAHIYCSEKQFANEFRAVNEMYLKYFKIFGVEKYIMRFSTHDPKELGKKYVDEPELWLKTEKMVRDVLIESKIPYVEVPNEAAFYGPKIDVQVWSAIGKEFTLATNQVDFAVPKRFDLTFTNKEGKAETPLCIHRAPLGTHERFIGFLIEHYAGIFPLWLSPVQVKVIPVRTNHNEYAKQIFELLKENNIRAELDDSDENLGTKVRDAKNKKMPYWIVIGDKEIEAKKVTLESRLPAQAGDAGQLGQISKEELVAKLVAEVKIKI